MSVYTNNGICTAQPCSCFRVRGGLFSVRFTEKNYLDASGHLQVQQREHKERETGRKRGGDRESPEPFHVRLEMGDQNTLKKELKKNQTAQSDLQILEETFLAEKTNIQILRSQR